MSTDHLWDEGAFQGWKTDDSYRQMPPFVRTSQALQQRMDIGERVAIWVNAAESEARNAGYSILNFEASGVKPASRRMSSSLHG